MRVGDTAWNESPAVPVLIEPIELSVLLVNHIVPAGPAAMLGPDTAPRKLVITPAGVIRPM